MRVTVFLPNEPGTMFAEDAVVNGLPGTPILLGSIKVGEVFAAQLVNGELLAVLDFDD